MKGKHKELDQSEHLDLDKMSKQFRASMSKKRLSGRPSFERLGSAAKSSVVGNPSLSSLLSEDSDVSAATPKERHGHHENLVKQVTAWLKQEKARRAARRSKRKATSPVSSQDATHSEHPSTNETAAHSTFSHATTSRRGSESSEGSVSLEHLASILERTLSLKSTEASPQKRRPSHAHKLSSIMKVRLRQPSSG